MGKNNYWKKALMFSMVLGMVSSSLINVKAQNNQTPQLIELERNNVGNLIKDSSFEEGRRYWKTTGQGAFSDYDKGAATGKWFGLLPVETGNACVYQNVVLKPNTEYVAKAKIMVGKEGGKAFFNVKNSDVSKLLPGAEIEVNFKKESEWQYQNVELKFNSKDFTDATLCVMKWTEKNNDGIYKSQVHVDDLELYEVNATVENDKYDIKWFDDFNGNKLDSTKWEYELGTIRGREQQHYVKDKENVYLKDGKLVLQATKRKVEDQYDNPRNNDSNKRKVIYNSGSIRTHGKKEFLYGRLEIKAKLPKGKGVFPAFWTLGSEFLLDGQIYSKQGYGWARCGEIDIMELIGKEGNQANGNKTVWQTAHTDNNKSPETKLAGTGYTINEDFNNAYHTFGINWSKNKIEWYVDNKIVQSVDYSNNEVARKALNKPQYIQLNLAMGGDWPGDAGNNLEGTKFEVEHVIYGQTAKQEADAAEYYKDGPKLKGVKDLTIVQGESDVLSHVSTNGNYFVDFSIDDSPQFKTGPQITKVSLKCKGKEDLESLKKLPIGTYNINYTAIPNDVEFEPDQWNKDTLLPKANKEYKFDRKSATLTIVERKNYKVLNPNKITIYKNQDLVLKSDAKYIDFKDFKIDDISLNHKYYKVSQGSTIVTVNKDFINNLKLGSHSFKIISKDGMAKGSFELVTSGETLYTNKEVPKKKSIKNKPKTGDQDYLMFELLGLISFSGIVFIKRKHI